MKNELQYKIALTLTPEVGIITAKKLIEHFGNAKAIFNASVKELRSLGVNNNAAQSICSFKDFAAIDTEISFIEKYNIRPIFYTDKDYPKRLHDCYDPPILLYYKGNADLNESKIISIIGTRENTVYGKWVTENIIQELSAHNVLVVSGLAYGIDTIAHKAALKNGLSTIGVLANGLQTIYPSQNKMLAAEIVSQGGLLTELLHNAKPDKFNFPKRNRIVAGLADATIVVETSRKGGSMITAEIAHSYGRDVFAVPGKINDRKSTGCNLLIQSNRAEIFLDTEHFLNEMNWLKTRKRLKQQVIPFVELSEEEQKVVEVLRSKPIMHIDELLLSSGVVASKLANVTLSLELAGILISLPGKMYQLI